MEGAFQILCQIGQNPNVDLMPSMEKSLAKLLQVMSRILGYKIEGLEILEGGYTPQAWATIENDVDSLGNTSQIWLRGKRQYP